MAEEQAVKHFVRISNTDLPGQKSVLYSMQKIKGIGVSYANALCRITRINPDKKMGLLTDQEVAKLDATIKDPLNQGIPVWLVNRRKDHETGNDKHLITGDLSFQAENDIRLMKKIKCYKGIRHILGQPVRGQRTRGNFRKNKGKVMGVKRSAGAKKSSGGKT